MLDLYNGSKYTGVRIKATIEQRKLKNRNYTDENELLKKTTYYLKRKKLLVGFREGWNTVQEPWVIVQHSPIIVIDT